MFNHKKTEVMEQKKRVRPTWAMVRELEAKLADQIEGTSQLVKDCDLWREKYRVLKERYDKVASVTDDFVPVEKYSELNIRYAALDTSYVSIEGDLERLRKEYADLVKNNEILCDELNRLKGKGFFARLFSR